jgi:N-acetylglucosaminyl-diphospho-decaprenol L-rhamnosyltransferase
MDLSTVIVHYRSLDALLSCLATLPDSGPGLASETLVVDNDPVTGANAKLAQQWFPATRIIENAENVGYARAVNQGIAATSGAFVLIMNPDCELRAGAVRRLVDYLRAHPKAALAAPRILNPDGSIEYSVRSYPDQLTFLFNRYSLLTRLFPGNPWTRRYLLSDWDHASVRDVDWASGACLLARREAIEKVGGMDEAFFMFNEDVDWCRRMTLAGWHVAYVPDAVCVHHIGASRRRTASRVILERHRGMIHYFHKHHPIAPPLSWLADALILTRAWLMIAANALKPR